MDLPLEVGSWAWKLGVEGSELKSRTPVVGLRNRRSENRGELGGHDSRRSETRGNLLSLVPHLGRYDPDWSGRRNQRGGNSTTRFSCPGNRLHQTGPERGCGRVLGIDT
jgi:hypothetical protein